MKWTKIKSIILCFLLAMNIFMLVIITVTSEEKMDIPKKVVDSSISVLSKSGFEIESGTFPDTYHILPSYNAKFYSASDLSSLFFNKQLAFSTTGNSLIAKESGAILTVNGNHFTYESNESPVKADSNTVKKALEKIGISMKGAVYDEKEDCFYRMYNKVNLFNMSIQAKVDKNKNLCYVNAYWPKELTGGSTERISFIESAMKLKELFPSGGKVQNIELGYTLQAVGGEKYTFVPAWRAMVNDEIKILE